MKNNTKIAKNSDEAFDIGEKFEDQSHGWIQWKGTQVCMDVYCQKCGYHSHLDIEFAYHLMCPKCKTVYACNGHIQLVELKENPDYAIVMDSVDGCIDVDLNDKEFWERQNAFLAIEDTEEYQNLPGAERCSIKEKFGR